MNDLEERLEEMFRSDARSRRVGRVDVRQPRHVGLAGAAFVASAAIAALIAVVALNTLRGTSDESTGARPSTSASASATANAIATPPGKTSGPTTAVFCGVLTDFVAPTATTTGRITLQPETGAPKTASIDPGTQLRDVDGYLCMSVELGAPLSRFRGLVTPGMQGYVAPSASASPAAASDRYGYVELVTNERLVVRRERDGSAVFEVDGQRPAVSPNGQRIAYWRFTPNVGATDLRVFDVADPSTARTVYTVTSGNLGGAIVWANDGLGLLVTTYSIATVGPPGGPPGSGAPAKYDLLMLDLATAPATARPAAPTVTGGLVYLPVGWDRPGRVASGVITGEGGFTHEYVLWNGNAPNPMSRVPLPAGFIAYTVAASPDAKTVAGVEDTGTIRVWPIGDPSNARTIRPSSFVAGFLWRSTSELIWTAGRQLQVTRVVDGSVTTVYTSNEPVLRAHAVRADGTAVFLEERSALNPTQQTTFRLFILDLSSRQATDVSRPTAGVGFVPVGVVLR